MVGPGGNAGTLGAPRFRSISRSHVLASPGSSIAKSPGHPTEIAGTRSRVETGQATADRGADGHHVQGDAMRFRLATPVLLVLIVAAGMSLTAYRVMLLIGRLPVEPRMAVP